MRPNKLGSEAGRREADPTSDVIVGIYGFVRGLTRPTHTSTCNRRTFPVRSIPVGPVVKEHEQVLPAA